MRAHEGHPHRRRLFWRVYLNGMLLVTLVALSVFAVGYTLRPESRWRELPDRAAQLLALRVDRMLQKGPERRADLLVDLTEVSAVMGLSITVYDAAGQVVASGVEPPLPRLSAEDEAALADRPTRSGWRRPVLLAARLAHGGYVLAAGPAWVATPLWVHLVMVFGVLLALAAGSYPLVRALVAPLEKLTATARALGEGRLDARSGIRRGDEVGALARAFDEMADRLQKLLRSEQALLANVSHELRTPLARIRVALTLAEEGEAASVRSYLSEITTDLDELEQLVGDVLTAARLDATLPLRREVVPSRALLERAAERFRTLHPDRDLVVDLGPDLPPVDADAALLRRVFDNLLDNARKYSDPSAPITLHARRGAWGGLVAEVRDRGIGIESADLPLLFTPFFRTDRSRARGTGGVGLGLALARRIAEAHGGRVTVESRAGEGSVFAVEVPAAGEPA